VTQTLIQQPLLHVTEEAWVLAREKERETDTHPCNCWQAATCMCNGACSCHWEFCQRCRRPASSRYKLCAACQTQLDAKVKRFAELRGPHPIDVQDLLLALRAIDPTARIAMPIYDETTILCAYEHADACAAALAVWMDKVLGQHDAIREGLGAKPTAGIFAKWLGDPE
jgi:hypothetical protein